MRKLTDIIAELRRETLEGRGVALFLDALEREGYAIVPREPTTDMICSAIEAHEKNPRAFGYSEHWRAMIRAGRRQGTVR